MLTVSGRMTPGRPLVFGRAGRAFTSYARMHVEGRFASVCEEGCGFSRFSRGVRRLRRIIIGGGVRLTLAYRSHEITSDYVLGHYRIESALLDSPAHLRDRCGMSTVLAKLLVWLACGTILNSDVVCGRISGTRSAPRLREGLLPCLGRVPACLGRAGLGLNRNIGRLDDDV